MAAHVPWLIPAMVDMIQSKGNSSYLASRNLELIVKLDFEARLNLEAPHIP